MPALRLLRPVTLSCVLVLAGCGSDPDRSGSTGGPPRGSAGADGGGAPQGEFQQGLITYYAATGGGNCMFDPTPDDLLVGAMNESQYAGSAACGECVEVEGPKGTVTVRIVDRCPECAPGHVDLSREAFARVANVADGRVAVRWRVVSCAVSGPVAYRFKEGSSQWWTALQVRNHRLPIQKLEWRRGSDAWASVPRESYNYFVVNGGVGPGPFQVRVTATDGQQLEDALPAATEGPTIPGAAQFR
jgi:expansin